MADTKRTTMNDTAIKVTDLCKKKGKKQILSNVSFEVPAGTIAGFLGPNGSGKTTTFKCILNLYSYEGSVRVFGEEVRENRCSVLSRIGSTIEAPAFYGNISGYRNLKLEQGCFPEAKASDIEELIDVLDMRSYIGNKVSTYSLGMKQRLCIAMALVHSPRILLLDEPMNGLDPEGIYELRNVLKRLSSEKQTTIIVSSHILSEMQLLCDTAVFIKEGRIIGVSEAGSDLEERYMELMHHEKQEVETV